MNNGDRTLYLGAHPDDVFIGAAVTILRNSNTASVLTVSNGASENPPFPRKINGLLFDTKEEYSYCRVNEDKDAFSHLGVDIDKRYFNGGFSDLKTRLEIESIVAFIDETAAKIGAEVIVTHEIPQSHPDHEVISFCGHIVGQRRRLDVWEYPMYGLDKNGKEVNREFLIYEYDSIFRSNKESFGKIRRDLTVLPETRYFYCEDNAGSKPEDVREAMKKFLRENENRRYRMR